MFDEIERCALDVMLPSRIRCWHKTSYRVFNTNGDHRVCGQHLTTAIQVLGQPGHEQVTIESDIYISL
jgi:hypothetical protein